MPKKLQFLFWSFGAEFKSESISLEFNVKMPIFTQHSYKKIWVRSI